MKRRKMEYPARPYVPPTAFLALSTCVACAFVLDAGWHRRADSNIIPWGMVGALMLGALAFAGIGLRRRDIVRVAALFASVGLVAGAVSGALWLARWHTEASRLDGKTMSSFDVLVRGDPSVGEFGASSTADMIDRESGHRVATVRLNTDVPYEDGTRLRAVGRMVRFDGSDWARSRFMKGEVAAVQVVKVLEEGVQGGFGAIGSLRAHALEAIGPECSEVRSLLAGTICGRTTELSGSDAQEVFSRCGLSHLVAVSGSHLALIAILINTVMERPNVRGAMRCATTIAVMAAYVAFTGCAASAMRSVVMVGASMASTLMGRRPHPLSGLALAASGLAFLNPGIVFDLGFQLSAMSVLFLLLFGKYVAFHLERLGLPGLISEPLSLTLVAQWATLPLTVPIFGEISIVAPLANLLVGPLMGMLLVAGLIAVPLAMVGFGFALFVSDGLAHVSLFLAKLCAGLPFASIASDDAVVLPLIAYGVAMAIFASWRCLSRVALACALGVVAGFAGGHIIRWSVFAPASVTVLDVGQADAILIREGASSVLVDAGVDEAVIAALARNHVFSLDAVVITHWDRDHWGGLPDVLDLFPVDTIVVAEGAGMNVPSELEGYDIEFDEVSQGDRLRIGMFSCEVIWPEEPVAGEENAESLCLEVAYAADGERGMDVLLTGDTERDELAEYVDTVGDIDVLKVGHHGSKISVAAEPLEILKPEYAIASAGEGNAYGHPDPVCIQELEAVGSRFLCTKDVGDVVMEPGEAGPVVHVARR